MWLVTELFGACHAVCTTLEAARRTVAEFEAADAEAVALGLLREEEREQWQIEEMVLTR